ncbi:MAG: hypothetical protein Q7K26_05715 [bacterium]|nr:hypothetical protein [bacterium]
MRKNSLLYTAFSLIIVLGTLHFIAETFYLYWTFWWLDIMMHLLAGFSGALVVLWFLGPFNIVRLLTITLVCLFIVAIAWEIFEYVYDLTQSTNYWQDTILDLIADGIGAFLAYFYVSEQTPKSS